MPSIKPVDTVRKAADVKPADLEGIEGRWLDVPRLQQRSSEVRSNFWCGRASAAMIYNYYCKAAGKADQYIDHEDGDLGKGANGAKFNLRFSGGPNQGKLAGVSATGQCYPAGIFEAAGWKSDSGELAKDQNPDLEQVESYFARHVEQLKKNNPIVQFTQLTKHRGHIVVICGYKKSTDKGELWLRIVDPCYPHEDLLGSGNYKMITRPETPDQEFSEYWLLARRFLEPYPGRPTRLYAHGDSPLGHFFYAVPDQPVKDDSELVHKVGKGLGATSTVPAADPAAPKNKKGDKSSTSSSTTSSATTSTGTSTPPAGGDAAPKASSPPLTGVPRLPFELNGSNLVTGDALTSLYHQTERGLGGFFPLGDSGLFHCGAHISPRSGTPILAMADGEVVAARIGMAAGEHPWGDTGFVLLRHKLQGDKKIYSLYMHLKKEPLHPDTTDALWLRRLLIDAMEDPNAPKKPKWRVKEEQPTWKDADKGRFSPTNVDTKDKLPVGVYEEDAELVQDSKRYVKLKEKWIRVIGPDGGSDKVTELSPFSNWDLETAAKQSPAVKALKDGKVAVLDSIKDTDGKNHKYTIEAGETVGRSGRYLGSETLHWSVFSKDAVFPSGSLPDAEFDEKTQAKVADLDLSSKDPGTKEHATALIEALDPKKEKIGKEEIEWVIEPGELRQFYRTPTDCWRGRYQAVKGLADFKLDLDKLVSQDRYKSHTDAEKGDFKKNGKAFLFWDELSEAEDFPTDGKAVFVHPVTALRLMSDVRLSADHDDPPEEPGTNADDRTHAGEDVVVIVRDAKGPLAAVEVTVKADGKEVLKGKTDSQGELVVKLEDVQGKDVEISVDKSAVGDKGQLVQVANETSAPGSLTPGDAPGAQTFNGDEVVPNPRLALPMKITKGSMVRQYGKWNADKFEPEAQGGLFDPEASVVAERIVFRKDDGKWECVQTFVGETETYFWSIEDGKVNAVLDLPAEKQGKDPQILASWSQRIAHLQEHPVLAGRVQNIADGTEIEITWQAMMAKGAPEHDHELGNDKVKVAAGGFAAAFDPHVLTSDNNLLNAPRPVYGKLKAKDKDFPLRDQAVTIYGDAKFPDPVQKPPDAQQQTTAAGKELTAFFEVQRDDATDHFTGWSKDEYPTRALSQLTGAVTTRLKGDGQDKIWIAACSPSQHLALESEAEKPLNEALLHHALTLKASFPEASDWVIATDPASSFAAGNGMQTGICAVDCPTSVTSLGKKSGCTEQVRVKNLSSCQNGIVPDCAKVVQLGSKPSVKKDACPDDEISCAAAGHDKSHCFLDGVVKGDGAEERERWHVRLPMRTAGAGYPYLRDDHKNLRVLLINPASGAAVVCSQEARGPLAKSAGNVEVPEAAVQKDEFKDKDTVLAASYETFWKLGLPRSGGGDAVVLIAFVDNVTPLGPLADDAPIKLQKNRGHPVAMGDSPPLLPGVPGEKVKSSNITVGGKHFVDWYNQDLRSAYPGTNPDFLVFKSRQPNFPGPLNKAKFAAIFDNVEHLWAPEITLQEFVGMFLIFANETGGTLTPLGERGGKKYWFEKGLKASYNTGMGTIPAGTKLRELGVQLSDDDFDAWNGTGPYPDDSNIDANLIEQCDFVKFRGHGLIQLTFRGNYKQHCEPSLKNYYGKGIDDFSTKELEDVIFNDPKVYLEMVRSFFKMLGDRFAKVNDNDFYPTGKGVSGGDAYGKLYEWRCGTLLQEMTKATFEFR